MQPGILTRGTIIDRVFHDSPVGMTITSIPDGRFVDVNAAFATMLGFRRDELIGRTLPELSLADHGDRSLAVALVRRCTSVGGIPLALEASDGKTLSCVASIQLEQIGDQDYFIAFVRDLTGLADTRAAAASFDNRFQLLFHSIPLPVLVFDEHTLQILEVNAAAGQFYGWSRDELVGRTILDLATPAARVGLAAGLRLTAAGDADGTIRSRHQLSDGSQADVILTSYAFRLGDQTVRQTIVYDVTEQLAIRAEMEASEDRLRLIASMATDAIWDRDLTTDQVEWSGGLFSLFGYSGPEVHSHSWWLEHIHPDDRGSVDASQKAALASNAEQWSAEYRFLRTDGRYVPVLDRAHIMRDANGKACRLVGSMVDMAEQRHEVELAAQARREARTRLARELHSSVTQTLYSVNLMAEASRRYVSHGDDERLTESLARLGSLSRQALRQLRLLLYEMRPEILETGGLERALRHRLEAVEQRAGMMTRLTNGFSGDIPTSIQRVLYRVTQEVLNQFLTQTSATKAIIALLGESDRVCLELQHHGLAALESESMLALSRQASTRHAIETIGGTAETSIREGVHITRLHVPLSERDAEFG